MVRSPRWPGDGQLRDKEGARVGQGRFAREPQRHTTCQLTAHSDKPARSVLVDGAGEHVWVGGWLGGVFCLREGGRQPVARGKTSTFAYLALPSSALPG